MPRAQRTLLLLLAALDAVAQGCRPGWHYVLVALVVSQPDAANQSPAAGGCRFAVSAGLQALAKPAGLAAAVIAADAAAAAAGSRAKVSAAMMAPGCLKCFQTRPHHQAHLQPNTKGTSDDKLYRSGSSLCNWTPSALIAAPTHHCMQTNILVQTASGMLSPHPSNYLVSLADSTAATFV